MPNNPTSSFNFRTNLWVKYVIAIATTLIITAMFPVTETIEADYSVGMVWGKEDLIAPFSFPIYKSETTYQKEVNDAREKVFPIFNLNNGNGRQNWLDSLNSTFFRMKKVLDYQSEYFKDRNLPEEKRATNMQTLTELKREAGLNLTDDEWNLLYNNLVTSSPNTSIENFKKKLIQILNRVYEKKLIDIPRSRFKSPKLSYIKNKIEENQDFSDVYDVDETTRILNTELSNYFNNQELVNTAKKIAVSFIIPDLKYNQEETDKILNAVSEAVPRTIGIVRENEKIVSKHDVINEMVRLKLESYKRVRNEQMSYKDVLSQQAGRFLFVATMLFLVGIFFFKMRSAIFEDNIKIILISTIVLLECFLSYLSLNLKIDVPGEYLVFIAISALLLTIIFDSRVSFYVNVIICILVSAIRGGDYDILVPNFTAAIMAIYSVRDIKKRSQIFVSMIYVLIGYTLTILAMGIERNDSFDMLKSQLYVASVNSVLSPILAYGLLIFYEKVFGVATDLVFLELSDFNNPLLRELSSKAPGTFHHSIVMGNLSEQAAKEIGANQILARVGCYYHDIGKIVGPDYFVENQLDTKNKHEQLNPSLSAKMIISHVKNGIKLAEKYRIPEEIINFIPMHHGTTLVSYFYEKARTEEGTTENIHDYIYRYPGPKPQSKETGIVMLADAVEAATRAIEDPTPAKLETQIDEIIKSRFMEGELDDCDLTLKDLIRIKHSFLKTLVGIHHHRIKYPEQDEDEEK
ncbi:MAG: HD family phosphohydrolase [Ignavibacteria bacterium]